MGWYQQRKQRKQRDGSTAWYYEVVWKQGAERVTVSLGFLGEDQTAQMKGRLSDCPSPSALQERLGCADDRRGGPPVSEEAVRHAVKRFLVENAVEIGSVVLEESRQQARWLEAQGSYGDMRLRDFYDHVWGPIRKSRNPATFEREGARWKAILHHLGHVPIKNLDALKWDRFLMGRISWGGTSKRIAQNEYRQLLKYAVKVGAIKQVHPFEPISGSTKRQRPVEPLTEEEIPRVLDSASNPMHRALFAVAIGQGTRRGEVTRLRWEHIGWEKGELLIPGTKNDRARAEVPMLELTRYELERFWIEQDCPAEGLCFTFRKEPIGNWRKAFLTACRRAGITRRVTPGMCRHTLASQMALNGVPKVAAKVQMRHSKRSSILEEWYESVDDERAAREVRARMPSYRSTG